MNNKITEDILPALQGVIPSVIASSSRDGIPNVTYISQVFYVDETHVAVSRQFFNKTVRNIEENPIAQVFLTCPVTYAIFKILMHFRESQKEGEIFDTMSIQLEAIASFQGKTGIFKLLSADIFEVLSIDRIFPF